MWQNPRGNVHAERRKHRINSWMSVGMMAVPGPRRPHQAGERLRPPAWSLSRKGLPRIRRPPCRPATPKTSISAATSSINMLGARAPIPERADLRHQPDHDSGFINRTMTVVFPRNRSSRQAAATSEKSVVLCNAYSRWPSGWCHRSRKAASERVT
jgi:hypothetical protein